MNARNMRDVCSVACGSGRWRFSACALMRPPPWCPLFPPVVSSRHEGHAQDLHINFDACSVRGEFEAQSEDPRCATLACDVSLLFLHVPSLPLCPPTSACKPTQATYYAPAHRPTFPDAYPSYPSLATYQPVLSFLPYPILAYPKTLNNPVPYLAYPTLPPIDVSFYDG